MQYTLVNVMIHASLTASTSGFWKYGQFTAARDEDGAYAKDVEESSNPWLRAPKYFPSPDFPHGLDEHRSSKSLFRRPPI